MNKLENEKALLRMLISSALQQGAAVSDKEHILTVARKDDRSAQEVVVISRLLDREPIPVMATDTQSAYDVGADYWLAKKLQRYDDTVFHETWDSSTPGVSWGWFKNHTIVPMVVCTYGSMSRFISKMDGRVAEAASGERWEIPEGTNEKLHGESAERG